MERIVFFVYYTSYYYFVDSVWDNREDAQSRLDILLKSHKDWDIHEVTMNKPGGANHD